jgi:hypothetical protein
VSACCPLRIKLVGLSPPCLQHHGVSCTCRFTAMQGPQHDMVGRACEANREALQEAALRMAVTRGPSALGGDSAALAVEVRGGRGALHGRGLVPEAWVW